MPHRGEKLNDVGGSLQAEYRDETFALVFRFQTVVLKREERPFSQFSKKRPFDDDSVTFKSGMEHRVR